MISTDLSTRRMALTCKECVLLSRAQCEFLLVEKFSKPVSLDCFLRLFPLSGGTGFLIHQESNLLILCLANSDVESLNKTWMANFWKLSSKEITFSKTILQSLVNGSNYIFHFNFWQFSLSVQFILLAIHPAEKDIDFWEKNSNLSQKSFYSDLQSGKTSTFVIYPFAFAFLLLSISGCRFQKQYRSTSLTKRRQISRICFFFFLM